jgi:hypothetical protein
MTRVERRARWRAVRRQCCFVIRWQRARRRLLRQAREATKAFVKVNRALGMLSYAFGKFTAETYAANETEGAEQT